MRARITRELKRRFPELRAAYALRRGYELLPAEALERTFAEAIEVARAAGAPTLDYVEFGVGYGTSLRCYDRASRARGAADARLVGFDSFQGLPADDEQDDSPWEEGAFAVSERVVRWNLRRPGVDLERIRLIPGWFEESLTAELRRWLGLTSVGVVFVDADLYASSKVALEWVRPLIVTAAVIVFDDWHSHGLAEADMGEKRAFDELLAAHPQLHAEPVTFPLYDPEAAAFLVTVR